MKKKKVKNSKVQILPSWIWFSQFCAKHGINYFKRAIMIHNIHLKNR
jgi:hypothetical protein